MVDGRSMEAGEDGALDHHGEELPVLSERASKMKYEELIRLSTPNHRGKTPGSPFFTAFGYFCLRLTKAAQFRRTIVTGQENIPTDRGSLCTSWHTNGLMDPVQIMLSHPRRFVIGARHDLVLRPILGWWARKFAVQPVIRKAELIRGGCTEEEAANLNGRSLRALADGISSGFGCALFPEGTSHSESHLIRLRTGPMRTAIAAAALSRVEERKPPVILPVGLHFRVRHLWRTDCWIEYEKPIEIPEKAVSDSLVEKLSTGGWQEPDQEAVRALRDTVTEHLSPLTPAAPDWKTHRAWHVLGHLRARSGNRTLGNWREEVLAAREARDSNPEGELMEESLELAEILEEVKLDGRAFDREGNLRTDVFSTSIRVLPSLLLLIIASPIFLYSCGLQIMLGQKFGNKTDEGLDARTSFQFLAGMFGSLILWPLLSIPFLILLHMSGHSAIEMALGPIGDGIHIIVLTALVHITLLYILFWIAAWMCILGWDALEDLRFVMRSRSLAKGGKAERVRILKDRIISRI